MSVVSLPQETFIPHGAGTKASVVFLQKLEEEELEKLKKKDFSIFRAICERIGYDIRGRTIFKKNEKGEYINEKGGVVKNKEDASVDSDIQDIIDAFEAFLKCF